MKLIAYGKVMEDDNKNLKEYSIKEGDFLVVMISKVPSFLLEAYLSNRQNHNLSPKQKNRNKKNQQPLLKHNRLNRPKPKHNNSNQLLSSNSNQQLSNNQQEAH